MSSVHKRLVSELRDIGFTTATTYGYITKSNRIKLNISKSHSNDAFVIAGASNAMPRAVTYGIKLVRKNNRKLFKGARSHLRNQAPRWVLGFRLFDKVEFKGKERFIFGRRSSGYFNLRNLNGVTVHASAKACDLKRIEGGSTMLIERQAIPPSPEGEGFLAQSL